MECDSDYDQISALIENQTKPLCHAFAVINQMVFEQHASGKKFQDVLEESFIHPLNIQGELYVGIPPGMIRTLSVLISACHLTLLMYSIFQNIIYSFLVAYFIWTHIITQLNRNTLQAI